MTNNREEEYWVGSNGEAPERIYFYAGHVREAAFVGRHRFIDAFDIDGLHLRSYRVSVVNQDSTLPDFPTYV